MCTPLYTVRVASFTLLAGGLRRGGTSAQRPLPPLITDINDGKRLLHGAIPYGYEGYDGL